MDPPSNIEVKCPKCEDVTIHHVLKGRLGKGKGSAIVLDATVRCSECQRVHHVHIRHSRPVMVPVIVSRGIDSVRKMVEMPRGETLRTKDEFEVEGARVQVTSIEKGGKRVTRAKTEEIDTVWSRDFDMLNVKVSVFWGRRTVPETILVEPESEFTIGESLKIKDRVAVIETIKVQGKTLRKGTAEARDIVRIYARLEK